MSSTTLLSATSAATLSLLDEATPVPAGGILSRTLLQTPELRLISMQFAPGQELTTHTSARRVVVQVVDGACEFQLNASWQHLERGSLVHLPPHQPHAVRASTGPLTLLLTLVAETAAAPEHLSA